MIGKQLTTDLPATAYRSKEAVGRWQAGTASELTNLPTGQTINKMRNKILNQRIVATVLSLAVFVTPMFVWAQVGVPCGDIASGQKMCEFNDLIILANKIIKFLIFSVAVPLTALGFMWIGGKLVINQDKEGAWNEAKQGFELIIKGFLIMLGAYVLIKTALFALIKDDQKAYILFMFQ